MISGEAPIAISFDGSNLDESADPELAPLGTLTTLLNYEKDRMGVLRRRGGFEATNVTSWTQSRTVRLVSARGVTASLDEDSVWSWDPAFPRWRSSWQAPSVYLHKAYDIGSGYDGLTREPIVAAGDNVIAAIWGVQTGASSDLFQVFLDASTLRPIAPVRELAKAAVHWKLIRSGSSFFAYVGTTTSITEYVASDTLAADQFSSIGAVITDLDSTNPVWDVCPCGTTAANRAALFYHRNAAGAHSIRILIRNNDTTTHVTENLVTSYTPVAISCDGRVDDTNIFAAAATAASANIGAAAVDQSGNPTVGWNAAIHTVSGGTVEAIGLLAIANDAMAVAGQHSDQLGSGAGSEGEISWQVYDVPASTFVARFSQINRTRGCLLHSKPFTDGVDLFVWLQAGGSESDTTRRPRTSYVLARLTRAGASYHTISYASGGGRFAYETDLMMRLGLGGFNYGINNPGRLAARGNDDGFWFAAPVLDSVRLFHVRSVSTENGSMVPSRVGELHVVTGGAQPHLWDGTALSELGFSDAPAADITVVGSGGDIAAGNYQYAITAEFEDAFGNRYQSAPWFSGTINAAAGNNSITLEIDGVPLTNKIGSVVNRTALRLVVWRTQEGPGATFFRNRSTILNAAGTSATVTITDTKDDADLLSESTEPLYAHPGGDLANEMPPPTRHLSTFGSRVAGIDAEYEGRIWFSKELTPGEGIAHSSILEQYVHGIGDLRALLEMDGSLYALGDDGIALAAYGDGPNNAGQGSWPQAQTIARGVSCFGGHCVAVIPDGAVFAGTADNSVRIWLLPRGGGQPVVISNPVKQSLDGATTIKRVMAVTDRSKVFVAYSDTGLLVYDYANKRPDGLGSWSRWTPGTIGALEDLLDVDGTLWVGDGDQPDVASLTEDLFDTSRTSVQTAINTLLGTANIRPARPFAAGKVNAIAFAAEYQGDATLAVQHIGAETKVGTFAFSSLTAGSVYNRYWQPDVVRDITGQGFRLLFACSATTGGVIPRFAEVDYVTEQGGFRPADAERA